jgi:metal-responsive CopG/Arc/MetJ family transcriptional regulator
MAKDAHISLRLPEALSDGLDRAAEERGAPKSALVREAVAAFLSPARPSTKVRPMLATEFVRLWETAPHLSAEEAASYEADIRAARDSYPPPDDPWA